MTDGASFEKAWDITKEDDIAIVLFRALSRLYADSNDPEANHEAFAALSAASMDFRNDMMVHSFVRPDEVADDNPQRMDYRSEMYERDD